MTEDELKAIEERFAATPAKGPMVADRRPHSGRWAIREGALWIAGMYFHEEEKTAVFLAATFEDIPALTAEVRRLQADRKKYRDWLGMSDEAKPDKRRSVVGCGGDACSMSCTLFCELNCEMEEQPAAAQAVLDQVNGEQGGMPLSIDVKETSGD